MISVPLFYFVLIEGSLGRSHSAQKHDQNPNPLLNWVKRANMRTWDSLLHEYEYEWHLLHDRGKLLYSQSQKARLIIVAGSVRDWFSMSCFSGCAKDHILDVSSLPFFWYGTFELQNTPDLFGGSSITDSWALWSHNELLATHLHSWSFRFLPVPFFPGRLLFGTTRLVLFFRCILVHLRPLPGS